MPGRFDPLKLGADPEALRWFQQAELVHSRLAMTAAAGIVIPGVSERCTGRSSAGREPLALLATPTICSPACQCLQLLSKIGALPNLPEWPVAGKVWIENHKSFPLGEPHYCLKCSTTVLCLPRVPVSWLLLSTQP